MSRLRIIIGSLAMPVLVGAIIFASAGTWDLPMIWALLGIVATFCVVAAVIVDRGLVRERVAPGPGNRDRLTRPIAVVMLLSHWILVGLDAGRFHWSPIDPDVQLAGLLGYTAAMIVMFWVMSANPFYSSVVRVQTDRGHHTVDAGPYRFVRHPGYTATLIGIFAGGLALGSWLAMIPLAVVGVLFIRRTLVEDRMLQEELPGYADYARRVRYRLSTLR